MTVATPSAPVSPRRLRIAITSPDILAQIQHVFASKNLAVEVTGLPYVEVTVCPTTDPAFADGSAVGGAVRRLTGRTARSGGAAQRRLCAEYQLNVVEPGDRPTGEGFAPAARRRHLAAVPDQGADDAAPELSPRQREVMAMVSRGTCNAEIAATLRISEKTVKNHINRIFRALGASNRVEAVLAWQRHLPDGAVTRPGAARRRPMRSRRPDRGGTA